KGFVFLTLEDETGIANIIVRPDLFLELRAVVVGEPYLLVEGTLQIQEGVTSVKAERVLPLGGASPPIDSHDFRGNRGTWKCGNVKMWRASAASACIRDVHISTFPNST